MWLFAYLNGERQYGVLFDDAGKFGVVIHVLLWCMELDIANLAVQQASPGKFDPPGNLDDRFATGSDRTDCIPSGVL